MAEPESITAEILVTAEISPEDEHAIVDEFTALGVTARARMVLAQRGAGEVQWLILATLPLQAFLSALGSSLADGAVQALKRLAGRVRGKKPGATSPGPVLVLQDTATRLQIVLDADLPADAYRALVSLDLSRFRTGPLRYDWHRGEWRSELDEWRQQRDS